jgi:hypothetical protein
MGLAQTTGAKNILEYIRIYIAIPSTGDPAGVRCNIGLLISRILGSGELIRVVRFEGLIRVVRSGEFIKVGGQMRLEPAHCSNDLGSGGAEIDSLNLSDDALDANQFFGPYARFRSWGFRLVNKL